MKYVDAVNQGICDGEVNAFEFVSNGHCNCCAKDYEQQLTNEEYSYDDYNIYRILKNPVYMEKGPEVPLQQKAEMEFCEAICSRDPTCTAFEYD